MGLERKEKSNKCKILSCKIIYIWKKKTAMIFRYLFFYIYLIFYFLSIFFSITTPKYHVVLPTYFSK